MYDVIKQRIKYFCLTFVLKLHMNHLNDQYAAFVLITIHSI